MPSIIERNSAKAAARFTSGIPTGGSVGSISQGSQPTATWANWVSNFINKFTVSGGQMSYDGQNALLSIYEQNPFGKVTKFAASVAQVSELWGLDVDGGSSPAWTQISNGSTTITGFTSGTYYPYVAATSIGGWSMAAGTSGVKQPPTSTVEIWILAEVVAVNSNITSIKQWWSGGMAMYSTRV